MDPDAERGVRKPWRCDDKACKPGHRLASPLNASRLAPSAESPSLLDVDLTRCPMADLEAAATLVHWWRLTDGRLTELALLGVEAPSAAMTDAWLVLGDEVALVRHVLHKRAVEDAEKKADAKKKQR